MSLLSWVLTLAETGITHITFLRFDILLCNPANLKRGCEGSQAVHNLSSQARAATS